MDILLSDAAHTATSERLAEKDVSEAADVFANIL